MGELPTNGEILAVVLGEKPENIRKRRDKGEVFPLTEEQAAKLKALLADRDRLAIATAARSSGQSPRSTPSSTRDLADNPEATPFPQRLRARARHALAARGGGARDGTRRS